MDHFPLWCRTPLMFDMDGTNLTIHIEAAPGAAGDKGQHLRPGQAAWVDRPLTPQEPRTIVVFPRYLPDPMTFFNMVKLFSAVHMSSALTSALLTPDTLIRFRVANTGDKFEFVSSNVGTGTSVTGFGPITFRSAKSV